MPCRQCRKLTPKKESQGSRSGYGNDPGTAQELARPDKPCEELTLPHEQRFQVRFLVLRFIWEKWRKCWTLSALF